MWIIIGCFLCFSLNMTSCWLSYKLHFHNKTCVKFTAQYKPENLQLKICCMTRCSEQIYFKILLFMTRGGYFLGRAMRQKFLLRYETDVQILFS